MEKEAKSVGYQIVFTTHSTVILKELSGKNQFNKEGGPGDIEIAYLTDANRKLIVKRNPKMCIRDSGLARNGQGGEDEDATARLAADLARPLQLHEGLAEPAVGEHGGLALAAGPAHHVALEPEERGVQPARLEAAGHGAARLAR